MCAYQKCTVGDCGIRYEVCSENPFYANMATGRHICHAVFVVDIEMGNFTVDQHCFIDSYSHCTEECKPDLHSVVEVKDALYDCCCIGNICNNVTFTFT